MEDTHWSGAGFSSITFGDAEGIVRSSHETALLIKLRSIFTIDDLKRALMWEPCIAGVPWDPPMHLFHRVFTDDQPQLPVIGDEHQADIKEYLGMYGRYYQAKTQQERAAKAFAMGFLLHSALSYETNDIALLVSAIIELNGYGSLECIAFLLWHVRMQCRNANHHPHWMGIAILCALVARTVLIPAKSFLDVEGMQTTAISHLRIPFKMVFGDWAKILEAIDGHLPAWDLFLTKMNEIAKLDEGS